MASEKMAAALRCAVFGVGIIFCLGIYGVIQERIMSEPYDGEMFRTSVFLVFCNRLVAIFYAITMVKVMGEECKNKAPLWKYLAISFSNVCATWCQYEALKYVSFPVQMLGKSFKMMPVMIMGIIISMKAYGCKDWSIAAGVTGGVTMFLLSGDVKSKHGEAETSIYGLLLLLGFLGFDGFTSTFQEKLFKEHKTSKYNQMLYVNSCSAFVSLGTLLASGAAPTAIRFCLDHPQFATHAMSLSAAAVGGQFFIYSQVKEFGALVFALTMNLRQVISILISYIMYTKPITFGQVLALGCVFGTLFFKTYLSWISGDDGKKHRVANTDKSKTPEPATIGENKPLDEDESSPCKPSQARDDSDEEELEAPRRSGSGPMA